MNLVKVTPSKILLNYFWLITISAFIDITIGIGWISTLVLPYVIYYSVFKYTSKITCNILDVLWFVILCWMVLMWVINDYPNKIILTFRCIFTEIAYMTAYWLGRRGTIDIRNIIIAARVPLIITSVIGIYCFFFHPAWYESLVYKFIDNNSSYSENNILEAFRLRSIFPSPYNLAYFSSITLMFEFFYVMSNIEKCNKWNYIYISLLLLVSFLCMMRGPFICVLISLVLALLYSYKYVNKKAFIVAILIFSIIAIISIPIINSLDTSNLQFIQKKISTITESSDEFIEYRLSLSNNQEHFYLLGDGTGRHNMAADKYNPETSIRDGEYMKILTEQGYVGIVLFGILALISLVKAVKNFKGLELELCIIIMMLLCMIGANPLSTADKHCFIYWMVIGQISNYKVHYH